jgi:predicted MFS family arabinose efflux permease
MGSSTIRNLGSSTHAETQPGDQAGAMPAATGSTVMTRDVGERLVTRPFIMLGLADLAYFTAAGVAIYSLPLYVTGPVESDKAGAGLAFGAFAISAMVLRPLAGRLSDTHGRRPLLVGGALMAAVGLLLTPAVDSLASVVVLRLLLGVAEAAFFVAAFAALADLAPPSRLGEALSYNSLGLYLGLALGPPLGELLVERRGFTAAWLGAAMLAALAALVVVGIGETHPGGSRDGGNRQLIHRKAVPPALGFLASCVAMGGFLAFASLHAAGSGLRNASVPLFAYGIVVVVGRIIFAKVPDRLPSLRLGAASLGAIAGGLTVMALWSAPTGMIFGTVFMALGVTFSTPAFFAAIFATATPAERGAASGTASVALDLGIGGGPILLGLVAQAVGIPWAFGVAAGVAVAGAAWSLALARTRS